MYLIRWEITVPNFTAEGRSLEKGACMYPGILRKMEVSIRTRPDTILYDSETSKKSDLIDGSFPPRGSVTICTIGYVYRDAMHLILCV